MVRHIAEDIHIWIINHGEIQLVLPWKLHLSWLARSYVQYQRKVTINSQPAVNPSGYRNWPGRDATGAEVAMTLQQQTNHFLIGLKASSITSRKQYFLDTRTVAHTNSQQLWQHAKDVRKLNPPITTTGPAIKSSRVIGTMTLVGLKEKQKENLKLGGEGGRIGGRERERAERARACQLEVAWGVTTLKIVWN